jgi:hypothetical protein
MRYYIEFRNEAFAVIDRKTDRVVITCVELSAAKAHCRGLNR